MLSKKYISKIFVKLLPQNISKNAPSKNTFSKWLSKKTRFFKIALSNNKKQFFKIHFQNCSFKTHISKTESSKDTF